MINNNAISIFSSTITEQKQKQQEASIWDDSVFEDVDSLKNDYSGKAGELFASRLCKHFGIDYNYNEDEVGQDDGTYDITINGKKIEVKTARVSNTGDNWQHESLRDYGSDFFMFIDLDPEGFYLSIFPSTFDFSKRHPTFGRKPHQRKGSEGIYKFDFGKPSLQKGISAGLTIRVDGDTEDSAIKEFILGKVK